MNDLEKTFEYTKDSIRLSSEEKARGRAELLSFMQENPARVPVRSPFISFFMAPATRYAFAALLLVVLTGSGVTYAAEKSIPSDALYPLKVKVAEPVQVALTFDPKKRADLEVSIVNERLSDLASVSIDGTPDAATVALVTDSLNAHINTAQEAIANLSSSDHADDAFETASDLQSTLSVHADILDKVADANPEASSTLEDVRENVSNELEQTNSLVDSTQDAVENTATSTLDQSTDDQAAETQDSLATVREQIAQALSSFDASDRTDVNDAVSDIQNTIAAADQKQADGDTAAAYVLYNQAQEQLTSLQAAIEADQMLGIDTINASTTDSTASDSPETDQGE